MIKTFASESHIRYPLLALLACFVAFSAEISAPVTDTFHVGEYVGFLWHMRDYYKGLASFPLYVHGGMDYLPSVVAAYFFGDEAVITGTRVIIVAITAIAYFLFLDICCSLIYRRGRDVFWYVVLAFVFYYFTPPLRSTALTIGFLPVREVFLLLTIWCLVKYEALHPRKTSAVFIAAGFASAVVAAFWCYNRGVMAVAFVCLCLAGLCIRRRWAAVAAGSGAAVLCLAVLEYSRVFGRTFENVENIRYWYDYGSEITRYPCDLSHLLGYLGLLLLCVFMVTVLAAVFHARADVFGGGNRYRFVLLGLVAVQLLLVKTVFDRADLDRSFYGGWPSIMLFFYVGSRLLTINSDLSLFRKEPVDCLDQKCRPLITRAFKVSVFTFILYMLLASPTVELSYPRFIKYALAKTPDVELVSRDMRELVGFLKAQDIRCYYNWTNEGVVALLVRRELCTEYPYVHYVARGHEQEMLDQLKADAPEAIVYNSESWSACIDGKHVSERFPLVDGFIQANYRQSIRIGTYLVALRNR